MRLSRPTRTTPTVRPAVRPVAFDLYKDIHKGIRGELFALTGEAGRLDPADRSGRLALAEHLGGVADLLISHAEHEDAAVQPAIEQHLPRLAEQVELEHLSLEARIEDLQGWAEVAVDGSGEGHRFDLHRLHLELASFTGAYLAHQDLEERVIMPGLFDALGFEAILAIHEQIIGSIPPEQMGASLAVMLPAMNVDDRTELLGGMRAGAPAPVFEGVWALAGSVLDAGDHAAVGQRLGL
jgi:hypothetical protein